MKIPKRIRKASKLEDKNLVERALKLCEESGELAEAVLIYKGLKKSKPGTPHMAGKVAAIKEEAVDVLLMALDILVYMKTSDKQLTRYVAWKLDKWLDKYGKNK